MLRSFAALALVVALGGCALWQGADSADSAAVLTALRQAPDAAAGWAVTASPDPLVLSETGLAELALGWKPEQVRARYGPPTRERRENGQTVWEYERPSDRLFLRLSFPSAGPLSRIQAWAPSQALTRGLLSPGDPAARVTRKYGEPPLKRPWGDGEAWIYPAANAAFVVTRAPNPAERLIAGIVVGL